MIESPLPVAAEKADAPQITLKTVYVAAVGGQGGQVMVDWLFNAAQIEGYVAQAIALPGLSQRGGSTSFYMEFATSPDPVRDQAALERVVFSQFPTPGSVDLVIGQEFLELGRALRAGFGGQNTLVVGSSHRIFAVEEKMPMMGGRVPDANIVTLAKEFSRDQIIFDAPQLARDNKLDELASNALLLGALSAIGALPIREESYIAAIKKTAIAPDLNIKTFGVGRDYILSGRYRQSAEGGAGLSPEQARTDAVALIETRKASLPHSYAEKFEKLADNILRDYDPSLWPTLIEAIYQTGDYQSADHAATFLKDVAAIYALEPGDPNADRGGEKPYSLTEQYAKVLAAYMTYEDVIRVAQMKVAQGRFARIRAGAALKPNQLYEVTDFLKPDPYELYGLLPYPIVAAYNGFKRITLLDKALAGREMYLEMKPKTTSFGGYALVRGLLLLKPLRLGSHRYHIERARMERYRRDVAAYATLDYAIGVSVARAGQLVKGYGHTRRRTVAAYASFIDDIVKPLAAWESKQRERQGYAVTRKIVAAARTLALANETGIVRAQQLATAALDKTRAKGTTYADVLRYAESAK